MIPYRYQQIRKRLDNPRVVVHDPCAPSLAPTDADWPAPRYRGEVSEVLFPFPHRTRVRMAVVAAASALPRFERGVPDESRPRDALEVVLNWLRGYAMTIDEMTAVWSAAGGVGQRGRLGSAADACAGVAFSVLIYLERQQPDWALPVPPRTVHDAQAGVVAAAPEPWAPSAFFRWWWSRCRALLPIADATTADITWHDIDLPPTPDRPSHDDLPGDG